MTTLEAARAILRDQLGFPDFRPGQERAITSVLEGRDTLVVLPTGGGKSLCFQVPALMLPKLTVVVSPLISLMKDQVDALTARGLPAAFLNSTLTPGEISDRLARAERGELKLIYVAPERLEIGRTLDRLAEIGVSLLAVDEAHCISEWGHDFRPSYLRVRQMRQRLGKPVTIALTATATPEVRKDIIRQLAVFERKNKPRPDELRQEVQLGLRIHEVIARESGNSFIRETLLQIYDRLRLLTWIDVLWFDKWPLTRKEHRELVDAVTARDEKRAAKIAARHVKRSWEDALWVITAQQRGSHDATRTTRARRSP